MWDQKARGGSWSVAQPAVGEGKATDDNVSGSQQIPPYDEKRVDLITFPLL